MIQRIVITDLTRMNQGNVCIAGIDKDHNQIRPVMDHRGIPESFLMDGSSPRIFPFALVEFDLTSPNPQPPHTEDVGFIENKVKFIENVRDRAEKVLSWSVFSSVEDIFEQPILQQPGYYVKDCTGPRSLGTIIPKKVSEIKYEQENNKTWDFRLRFTDGKNVEYRLKITDLTFQYYCRFLNQTYQDHHAVAERIFLAIQSCQIYIRVGLARGWREYPDRCYLQVNGIYTFPDLFKGKTHFEYK